LRSGDQAKSSDVTIGQSVERADLRAFELGFQLVAAEAVTDNGTDQFDALVGRSPLRAL
jgi:hypothetical protein